MGKILERTQVLIAGAGPVGTVAAYYLAQNGIDVIVMEAEASCEEDLRASTLHSPTLSMLNQLGIMNKLEPQGLKAPVYQYRKRKTHECLSFDLDELKGAVEFPYRLQCEQYKLARLLTTALDEHPNAEVNFQHRVLAFEQDDDKVIATVETPYTIKKYQADYLIAADGANSIIRKWLGVEFAGFTYPEKFLTLSTTAPLEDYFQNLSYVNYISDPEEWLVLLRVPSVWRVLVPIFENVGDKETLSDEYKNKVFDGITQDGASVKTEHRTIYRVHQRVVTKYNHGRTLLIGDAAHLNNPLGGLGMNSGIHDAWNLCEKLVEILNPTRIKGRNYANALLEKFDRQRRTTMNNFIQAQTIQNKKMMEEDTEEFLSAEWERLNNLHKDDELRYEFLLKQSMTQSVRDAESIS
ncbi:MAG: 3-(3-hydroxy-phenyl)propionate hydroxylase [Dinoroseobacter sp.]